MRQRWNQISEWWCMRMHDSVMWPSHGQYRCRTCMREYAVQFESTPRREREQAGTLTGWVATTRA